MMIVLYVGILVAIIIYFVTRPVKRFKSTYKVAVAGRVDQVSPLTMEINDLSNKTFKYGDQILNTKDYEIFIVDGESMAPKGIHTGNAVLVTKLIDRSKLSLHQDDVVLFEIDPTRYEYEHPDDKRKEYGFKIRNFVTYLDLAKEDETLYKELKLVDPEVEEETLKQIFYNKISKARQYFKDPVPVLLSITYKECEKDYSVHSMNELYGKVNYIIPKEVIKII